MINMPRDITKLILPVPPGFGQVMGYSGNRKWVAFFWSPYGDELEYDDGHSAGTIEWPGRRIEAMVHWLDTVYDQIVRKGQA